MKHKHTLTEQCKKDLRHELKRLGVEKQRIEMFIENMRKLVDYFSRNDSNDVSLLPKERYDRAKIMEQNFKSQFDQGIDPKKVGGQWLKFHDIARFLKPKNSRPRKTLEKKIVKTMAIYFSTLLQMEPSHTQKSGFPFVVHVIFKELSAEQKDYTRLIKDSLGDKRLKGIFLGTW